MFKKIATAASAALLLASTAGVAQANSAQALSLSKAPVATRAASTADQGNELVGTTAWVLAAIGLGLVVWGVIELTGDDSP